MRLSGKVAVVTGGGSGIGRATAELFSREGAKALVADRDAVAGAETAHAIQCAGGEARFIPVDVSDMSQVTRMMETAVEAYGGVDILFNGAGILHYGTATETDEATWNRVIAV